MSVFSKVLAVVVLVMAVVTMMSSVNGYSTRVNWRNKFVGVDKVCKALEDKISADKEVASKEIATLRASLDGETKKATAAEASVFELRSAKEKLQKQLEEQSSKKEEALDALNSKTSRNEIISDEVIKMQSRVNELTEESRKAKASEKAARDMYDDTRTDLNDTRIRLSMTERAKGKLETRVAKLEYKLSKAREAGFIEGLEGGDVIPTAPVRGSVLAVRADTNIVMLSVGVDDQVTQGLELTISRGNDYIGKVRVERVFADMCSARILPDLTKGDIREGDDASAGL